FARGGRVAVPLRSLEFAAASIILKERGRHRVAAAIGCEVDVGRCREWVFDSNERLSFMDRTSLRQSMRRIRVTCGAAAFAAILLLASTTTAENRSYDGSGNNPLNPAWGAAGTNLTRMAPADYADEMYLPSGGSRPGAREISNAIAAQSVMIDDSRLLSSFVFQWGQFIDHDLDLTTTASPAESLPIPIPAGDPIFDPFSTGTQTMMFQRSTYDSATGTAPGNPRQQVNAITSYIDGSMVYGSSESRALALREMSGGLMKTSGDDLLPLNAMGLENATGGNPATASYFVAGDIRANEQVGLTAMHTLFVREHNRLAGELAAANPTWTDKEIFQRARKIVGAEIQAITYGEFLPALLGTMTPGAVATYDPNIDATVATEFSTALFRVGHTMLPPNLLRVQNDGSEAPGGPIPLRDAFFLPTNIASGTELEYLLKGLATQCQQQVDQLVVDDVRNFLFGEPMPGGFDLAALNIQRGRDHGLPDYNTVRVAYGLSPVASFAEITSDANLQAALAAVYGDVNDIDPWVGALSEDHVAGSGVGPLVAAALADQFARARDGDRFWYANDLEFTPAEIALLESTRLSDIIRRNTGITNLQDNVFFVVPEPSALALAAAALVSLAFTCRHRRGDAPAE
ncbi:MAG: hypothetical protein HUU06_02385, partial [Planctomycetaceae bacterium]|nr:hypothetical protein [Planctomycetaceae bacterium]